MRESKNVTTVSTYSHLNTPIDQWERAWWLNYFIKQHTGSLTNAKPLVIFSQVILNGAKIQS